MCPSWNLIYKCLSYFLERISSALIPKNPSFNDSDQIKTGHNRMLRMISFFFLLIYAFGANHKSPIYTHKHIKGDTIKKFRGTDIMLKLFFWCHHIMKISFFLIDITALFFFLYYSLLSLAGMMDTRTMPIAILPVHICTNIFFFFFGNLFFIF